MVKRGISIQVKILIAIMIIISIGVVGSVLYLLIMNFIPPSGDECNAWINQETLLFEQNCPEGFICVENRWGHRSSSFALGNDENNPAIGECVKNYNPNS